MPLWKSPLWGLRYLAHYLRLVADPSAWLYLGLAGAIVGFVSTYFTFLHFPYARFTAPVLTDEVLKSLGFAMYRILVPVMATILIAARCGAAVASDVGGKVYGQQLDALRTFGVRPSRYVLTGICWAFLIGTPLLVGISFLVAKITSLIVFTSFEPAWGPYYWDQHFHRILREPGQAFYNGTGWLLLKVLLCAAGIAQIGYHRGASPKYSGRDVSAAITSTVLWSTLYVLAVHFALAFFEFD
ncbi:MAG: ABC transporter permease [Planctomycetia bacterium]|nr:ABC transporter permease [Planctomycetia bacterium]